MYPNNLMEFLSFGEFLHLQLPETTQRSNVITTFEEYNSSMDGSDRGNKWNKHIFIIKNVPGAYGFIWHHIDRFDDALFSFPRYFYDLVFSNGKRLTFCVSEAWAEREQLEGIVFPEYLVVGFKVGLISEASQTDIDFYQDLLDRNALERETIGITFRDSHDPNVVLCKGFKLGDKNSAPKSRIQLEKLNVYDLNSMLDKLACTNPNLAESAATRNFGRTQTKNIIRIILFNLTKRFERLNHLSDADNPYLFPFFERNEALKLLYCIYHNQTEEPEGLPFLQPLFDELTELGSISMLEILRFGVEEQWVRLKKHGFKFPTVLMI